MERKAKPSSTLSISFTLPAACNICLGKVKEPVVCPNQHVFCSVCIDEWLKEHQHCPNCRVAITEENRCKKLIGAGGEESCQDDSSRTQKAELRRTRLDLICREYERDISQLEEEMNELKSSNARLEHELSRSNERLQQVLVLSPTNIDHCYTAVRKTEDRESSPVEISALLEVREQLNSMTRLYEKLKNSLRKLEEENQRLSNENFLLRSEIAHRRQIDTPSDLMASPRKVSRYTVAALESQLERYQRQEVQLKKALQRSDQYVEKLESDLTLLRREPRVTWKSEQTSCENLADDLLKASEVLDLETIDILDSSEINRKSVNVSHKPTNEKQVDNLDIPVILSGPLPVDRGCSPGLHDSSSYSCLPSQLHEVTDMPMPVPSLFADSIAPSLLPLTDTDPSTGMQSTQARGGRKTRHRRKSTRSPMKQAAAAGQGNLELHFPVRRHSFRLGSVGSFSSATGDFSRSKTGTVDSSGVRTLKWTL